MHTRRHSWRTGPGTKLHADMLNRNHGLTERKVRQEAVPHGPSKPPKMRPRLMTPPTVGKLTNAVEATSIGPIKIRANSKSASATWQWLVTMVHRPAWPRNQGQIAQGTTDDVILTHGNATGFIQRDIARLYPAKATERWRGEPGTR